jgi:hypothetical protein
MGTDWQTKYLPELCMMLHMEFTGASQDMSRGDINSCITYIRSRVARWGVRANGDERVAFDTAVLSLCLATLSEFSEWHRKFPTVSITQ